MNSTDIDDEYAPEEQPKSTRGKRVAVVVGILLVLLVVVELFAIQLLGTNANATFSKIGPKVEK